jgi:hypothetical protein
MVSPAQRSWVGRIVRTPALGQAECGALILHVRDPARREVVHVTEAEVGYRDYVPWDVQHLL